MRYVFSAALIFLFCFTAQAGVIRLDDEGVKQGYISRLNITGPNVAATKSGVNGLINIDPAITGQICLDPDTCFTLSGDTVTLTVHGTTRQTWTTVQVADYMLTSDGAGNYIVLDDGTSKIILP